MKRIITLIITAFLFITLSCDNVNYDTLDTVYLTINKPDNYGGWAIFEPGTGITSDGLSFKTQYEVKEGTYIIYYNLAYYTLTAGGYDYYTINSSSTTSVGLLTTLNEDASYAAKFAYYNSDYYKKITITLEKGGDYILTLDWDDYTLTH